VTADASVPVGAASTASTPGTAPAATGTSSTSDAGGTPAATTPTTSATAAPKRTTVTVDKSLTDPVLGHRFRVTRVSRNMPWPAGNPVSAANFEIVGLYVEVAAGDRYSATIAPTMFSLRAVPSPNQIQATTEFNSTFQGALAPVISRGQTRHGWVFFKMDKGATGPFVFGFHRPAYVVDTTNTVIRTKAYGVVIKP
jgi:hypothetical protein